MRRVHEWAAGRAIDIGDATGLFLEAHEF